MTSGEVLRVRGLVKRYEGRTVVDDIAFDLRTGEIVGLIGANGAGKTTTVECILGLRRPDEGNIRVFGLNPTTQSGLLRQLVGTQLQDSSLPDRLRVGEAVRLFNAGDSSYGNELLGQFGLEPRRRSAFSTLSGGERQRLFLVLALVNRPRLVILDELTQGLDPAARRGVWKAVDQVRLEGTTVLLVTHELDEAEALCDRVIAMRAGRILDSGAPAELIDRHGPRATIRFTLPERDLRALGLARLDGVHDVAYDTGRVTVRGDRRSIARVGAALVHGGPIPTDLSVVVPDLEDALIGMLERADEQETGRKGVPERRP